MPLAGFVLPDYAVERALIAGWALVRADPTVATDAFVGYGDAFIKQALGFLARREVAVFEGWPMEAAQIPGIGVTIQQASESAGDQEIGLRGTFHEDGARIDYLGTRFRTSVQIAHYAPTQRTAAVMALISMWLLLQARTILEEEEGLAEQLVTIADYNPNTNFAPENAFMRMVVFNCSYENTWAERQAPLIASIHLEVSTSGDEEVL